MSDAAGHSKVFCRIAGTSTGLLNLFPFAGAAVFQPLLGAILERSGRVERAFPIAGYKHAFFVLFLCGVGALVSSLFLRETLTARNLRQA